MMLLLCFPSVANASEISIEDTIEQIIDWKKQEQGIGSQSPLLQNPFLKYAGTTAGDWFPLALGRIGYADDFDAYLAVTEQIVKTKYAQPGKLDETKATEWHRMALAILATGGDPTNVQGIDLISDGTYNRALTAPLDLQGINGLIWGLISLDSMRYVVPNNAETTRAEIIKNILAAQLPDGGFSFYHDTVDADITSMALQALAPYANSFEKFTYIQQATKAEVTKDVRAVIEEALAALSTIQLQDGTFGSWNEANAESTVQVLVALAALQIDPLTDSRFIKNGLTVLDGLMLYQQQDGGFIHSKQFNPDNPTSLPDDSNSMASEQALYALVAYKRWHDELRSLYDMRPEMGVTTVKQIEAIELKIANSDLNSAEELLAILKLYEELPAQEVMYITNFDKVQQAVSNLKMDYDTPLFSQKIGVTKNGKGIITPILDNGLTIEITKEVISEFVKKKSFSTSDYNAALRYIRFIQEQNKFTEYLAPLEEVKSSIEAIQTDINSLNEEILEHLYPITSITLQDKERVEQILMRFEQLAVEDQQQIINFEDLSQVNAMMDSLQRELWIKRALICISSVLLVFIGWRIWRKRRGNN